MRWLCQPFRPKVRLLINRHETNFVRLRKQEIIKNECNQRENE